MEQKCLNNVPLLFFTFQGRTKIKKSNQVSYVTLKKAIALPLVQGLEAS